MKSWERERMLFRLLVFLFLLQLIFNIIRNIFGGLYTIQEFMIFMLVANVGYTFYVHAKLSEHLGWHKGKEKKR